MNTDWKRLIPDCFGERDLLFAIHPLDHRRAQEFLRAVEECDLSWDEVELAVAEFLTAKGAAPEHVERQLDAVRRARFGRN